MKRFCLMGLALALVLVGCGRLSEFEKFERAEARGEPTEHLNPLRWVSSGPMTKESMGAVSWYRHFAGQGEPLAQYTLGVMYREGDGVPKDHVMAFVWFTLAAERGHKRAIEARDGLLGHLSAGEMTTAQYNIGLMYTRAHYRRGLVLPEGLRHRVPSDHKAAIRWIRIAAEQGHVEAQYNLGRLLYAKEEEGARNDAETVRWYRMAAEQGHVEAQFELGLIYAEGERLPQDDAEAVRWWRLAAEQGHARAQYALGVTYAEGRGIERDDAEAVRWYHKAAEQGHARAQYALGVMYREGRGVAEDQVLACLWFTLAAKMRHDRAIGSRNTLLRGFSAEELALAQYNIGWLHAEGGDIFRYSQWREEEALRWFQKAAEQGHALAQYNLGFLNDEGRGMRRKIEEETQWFRLAAKQGYAPAQFYLGVIYAQGYGMERDHAEAARWYQKAAEQGHTLAQYDLGVMYREGQGVAEDQSLAFMWFTLAAENGHEGSIEARDALQQSFSAEDMADVHYHFGVGYANGQGVKQDEKEAIRWWLMAAAQGHARAQYALGAMYRNAFIHRDLVRYFELDMLPKGDMRRDEDIYSEAQEAGDDDAERWYRLAAAQGYAPAQYALGDLYSQGYICIEGEEVDDEDAEAIRWYRLAAEQGHARAQYALGGIYRSGRGVTEDAAAAVRWLRLAGAQGHPWAQFELGLMYAEGRGIERDDAEAVRWYQKAAEQGDGSAQHNLGVMYRDGRGVAENHILAFQWFTLASANGHGESLRDALQLGLSVEEIAAVRYEIGLMYAEGRGLNHDDRDAPRWFPSAEEMAMVRHEINLMYPQGRELNDYRRDPLRWFRLAGGRGHADAQYALGRLYAERPSDNYGWPHREAREWFRMAAEQGHVEAQFSLGVSYDRGAGVLGNQVLAFKWFTLAAAGGNQRASEKRDSLRQRMWAGEIAEAERRSVEWMSAFRNRGR